VRSDEKWELYSFVMDAEKNRKESTSETSGISLTNGFNGQMKMAHR